MRSLGLQRVLLQPLRRCFSKVRAVAFVVACATNRGRRRRGCPSVPRQSSNTYSSVQSIHLAVVVVVDFYLHCLPTLIMPSYYDDATRAQVIALRAFGVTHKTVSAITNVQERTQTKMLRKAKDRGFIPGGVLLDEHIKDAPKSGAPRKMTPAFDDEVAKQVRRDRYGREKTIH